MIVRNKSWSKLRWALVRIFRPKEFERALWHEHITDAFHPDTGWFWRECDAHVESPLVGNVDLIRGDNPFKPWGIQRFRVNAPVLLNALAMACYQAALEFHKDPATGDPREVPVPEMIALTHSEISEALEGYRKDLMDDHLPHRKMVEVELADAMIRIFHMAGYKGYNIGGAFVEKLEYNRHRADHKLENRAKEGGKKF